MTDEIQATISSPGAPWSGSAGQIGALLRDVGYLADAHVCQVLRMARQLGKPVLVEGPAGTGKTELAKSMAAATGARLIRLQCYEGLDEGKALYEWNYRKQLLRILADRVAPADRAGPASGAETWTELESGIFTDDFLLTRPLLAAIRVAGPVVLLIDEVDQLDVEAEALLLEVLAEYQISIPEIGTVTATRVPVVFLTSNHTRELSEALRRRCLYLHIDYPPADREREIVRARVPGISGHLATQITAVVASLRQLDLRPGPSVGQTLEWARTLLALGVEELDPELLAESWQILLSGQADIDLAAAKLAHGQLP